jgi:glycosyltransferase involved in cell wall biosynthesis
MKQDKPEISVIVAAYNEEDNILPLYEEAKHCLHNERFELLFVDDGSRDSTAQQVHNLARADPRVRLVRLARNYGVQAAYLAGMSAARGRAIATLDCDLQHPPEMLTAMIHAWRRGAPIVVMRRTGYEKTGRIRGWASRVFGLLLQFIGDDPYVGTIGDFMLLDRRARNRLLRRVPSRPYWRALVPWLGFPLHFISYEVAQRHAGSSRFGLRALLRLFCDAVLTATTRPLRLSFYAGLATAAVVSIYSVVVGIAWFLGHSVPGYPTLIITLALLGSIQLIGMGIIGEYLGRVYDHTRGVPPFVIMEDSTLAPETEATAGSARQGD